MIGSQMLSNACACTQMLERERDTSQDEIYDRIVRKYVCAPKFRASASPTVRHSKDSKHGEKCFGPSSQLPRFCRSQMDWQPLIEAMHGSE